MISKDGINFKKFKIVFAIFISLLILVVSIIYCILYENKPDSKVKPFWN